jgi:hypothetical protein
LTADQAGATEPQLAAPFVIDPNGVYLPETVRKALKLRASSIRREVREGRLRVAKRCGRHYLLGTWILEWLAAGELSGARN